MMIKVNALQKQKILVILPNNLGDVIMAAPVLECLKLQAPAPHVTFFVEEGYEGGLTASPFCDVVFKFKRDAIRDVSRSSGWPMAIAQIRDTIAELKREKFDRVINLSQHTYISFMVSLLSCPATVGSSYLRAGNQSVRDRWSRYLYAIPFARRYNALHATDIYRRIAGCDPSHLPSMITVTEEERGSALKKIIEHGWNGNGKPMVVFQPGAAFAAKRWPLEHFAALGKQLINDGYSIVVTGAPQELAIATGLTGLLGEGCFTTAGILTFRETISLLPLAEACVTGDTAIMHAAAALRRKVYALFGPTNPVETGPYSEGNIVICGRCSQRPCFCFDCKTRLCMKSIVPDDVYSCIKSNGSVAKAGCDIYRTSFMTDGTFSLVPVIESGPAFFNRTGAMTTRAFAEPGYLPDTRGDGAGLVDETEKFLALLGKMAAFLASFMKCRDNNAIRSFEEIRAQLAGFSEIGAFWTAILNLRLNSVPLLDPFAAVRESLEICSDVAKEVNRAIEVFR